MTPTVVFVTGCSRSGTTPLVDVLNAHEAVVIGMERFKYLYPVATATELVGIFEPERFFDFRPSDTNVLPRGRNRWHQQYRRAKQKLERGQVLRIGDKPRAAPSLATKLMEAHPSARWIHILRGLPYVAASFEARANNPHDRSWPLTHGYREALRQWEDALDTAELLRRRLPASQLYHVSYEDFFAGDDAHLRSLWHFLDVPASSVQHDHYTEITEGGRQRVQRSPRLFPAALEWLEQRRAVEREATLRRLADRDRETWLSEQ